MTTFNINENITAEEVEKVIEALGNVLGLQAAQALDADLHDTIEDAMSELEDEAESAWGNHEDVFADAFKAAVNTKKDVIETEINERIYEQEVEKVKSMWPEIREYIVNAYNQEDECALDEGFNNYTDSLCKDGEISDYTYANITREEVEK